MKPGGEFPTDGVIVEIFGGKEHVPDADEGLGNPYVLAKQLRDAELAVLLWREGHLDEGVGIMLCNATYQYIDHLRKCLRRGAPSVRDGEG